MWQRSCRSDCNSVSVRFPCSLSRGLLKRDLLEIDLTTSFLVRNFGNTSAMRIIFFWKCRKFNGDFKNPKYLEKVFCFRDKSISIGCVKFSLLRKEYFLLVVNLLTRREYLLSVVNIFSISVRETFSNSIAFTVINKYAAVHISTVLGAHLSCCLSEGRLTREFLDNYLTTFFRVRNFGNTAGMSVIFFLKTFKI